MLDFLRRLSVPLLSMTVVGGVWFTATLKMELESPIPSTRVDPAVVQRAMRAGYKEATAFVSEAYPDPIIPSGFSQRG